MFLKPTEIFYRITDINAETLKKYNIKGLLIDVDNTLSTHGGQIPLENLGSWIGKMQSQNIKLYILSNAKKRRVEPFAKKVGLPFISLGLKPLPSGYLRGKSRMNLKNRNIAMVGDQLFTDVLGAKFCFMKTFLVRPILLEDKTSFKIRRSLENLCLKKELKKFGE